MDYIKISVTTTPLKDWFSDLLCSELGEIGFESFMETETGIDAFVPFDNYNESLLKELLSRQPEEVDIIWEKEVIEDRNWNEEWEKNYFEPLVVGGECLVRAPFHKDYPQCTYEIVIEPNMAFGTGNHETTSMMLEALLKEELTGKEVLDMGCGTGILGILAAMKGASHVTAIDIDEWPVKGTVENAALNGVGNITVKRGDAGLLGNDTFDYILANIHKNVLLQDLPMYAQILNNNGKLFMSGIYSEDIPELRAVAEMNGLTYSGETTRNNWVAVFFSKQNS